MNFTTSLVFDLLLGAVGLTFAYAATAKLRHMTTFCRALRSYDILPSALVRPVAFLLVLGESLVAVTHVGRLALNYAIPATLLMLSLFLVGAILLLRRDGRLPCLCFGANRGDFLDVRAAVRIGLLMLAELVLVIHIILEDVPRHTTVDDFSGTLELLIITIVGLVLLSWCFRIQEIRVSVANSESGGGR